MTSPGYSPNSDPRPTGASWVKVAIAWVLVGLPIAWGVYRTIKSAVALFR